MSEPKNIVYVHIDGKIKEYTNVCGLTGSFILSNYGIEKLPLSPRMSFIPDYGVSISSEMLNYVMEFYRRLDTGDFVLKAVYDGKWYNLWLSLDGNRWSKHVGTWYIDIEDVNCIARDFLIVDSYYLKHRIEETWGNYITNGATIYGALLRNLPFGEFNPPNIDIVLTPLKGWYNAITEIARTISESIYRGKFYREITWSKGKMEQSEEVQS